MRKITRTLFLTKDNLDLIDKDINAVNEYKVFSNKEEGTIEVEVTFNVPEEFRVTEDILMDIIQGLLPALSEKEHEDKFKIVTNKLREMGASI